MKWSYLLILLMNILLLKNQSCKNMDTEFCQALIDNDKDKLVKVVNRYLTTLNPEADKEVNFKKIKIWLEAKPCIKEVEIINKIIITRPPIAGFKLVIQNGLKSDSLILKINFAPNYQFYELKKDEEL